jgi:hypothetical protein
MSISTIFYLYEENFDSSKSNLDDEESEELLKEILELEKSIDIESFYLDVPDDLVNATVNSIIRK